MPLLTFGNCKTKVCKNKVVSANIHELSHFGKKKRSHSQIVAIAESAAHRKTKNKTK